MAGLTAPRVPDELTPLTVESIDDEDELEEVELRGDLSGAQARSIAIERSRLVGVRLTGADLPRLRLVDCVLEGCDLSGAFLEKGGWNRVALVDCRLSGTVLTSSSLRHVRWSRCRADDVVLRFTTSEQILFEECAMGGADLASASVTGGRILGSDLTSADVSQAKLPGLRLQGSTLDGVRGASALRGVVIASAQVVPVALAVFAGLGIEIDDEAPDAG